MSFDGTDPDFVWGDYLEDTQSEAAPPTAFTHVEYSIESGFKVGMKLEVPNPDDRTTYWPASVIMTCGDLLTLRYVGYGDDRSADFWFNIKSGEFHPIGWCSRNSKNLSPPKDVLRKCTNVNNILSKELNNCDTISEAISENIDGGFIPIDQIKCGMKLELIDEYNAKNVWIVTITQNIGGRLLLTYDGCEETSSFKIWLFYLSDRLNPVGFAKSNNMQYSPPEDMKNQHTEEEWKTILNRSFEDAEKLPFPSHIFEPKIPLEKHAFKLGMKLEAVNPQNYSELCPATVTKIVDDYYFLVKIDEYPAEQEKKCCMCCSSNTPFIFPVKWAEEHELELKTPKGYEVKKSKFSWDDYLQFCNAVSAPADFFPMCFMNMGFETNMKLEAADPFNSNNIHAATITKIMEPLMWLEFDDRLSDQRSLIYSVNSYDIYPVGWCASNSYSLHTPTVYKSKAKSNPVLETPKIIEKIPQEVPILSINGQQCKSWCPKIYFNHRCFTGPLLSKSRLAELPQAIGPGPLHLVIQEVIYRVVNIAYKSSRVLQILQVNGKPSPGMQQQIIKAKYKGKTNRATIEVIRNSEQVEEFCKNICQKLECCPYLFGPKRVGEVCPSSCHTQTKTKFGYNFVKKHKKIGRPPLNPNAASTSAENGEVVKKGPGRKKKRKHWTHLLNNARSLENQPPVKNAKSRDSSETDEGSKCDTKEKSPSQTNKIPLIGKKKLKHTPSSSIVTRGAKLPNFGLWHHVSPFHSRRGRPRTRPIRPFPPRKVGRPVGSTKKAIAAAQMKNKAMIEDSIMQSETLPSCPKPTFLDSNPLEWSVEDVVQYLQKTDYAPLAPLLKEQEIDGQALLMLNLFNVQEYLHLKPEPAEKFCYLIKNLKVEFFTHYVS
ncbi:scm-like with four MBT domains protein 2 [Trichonephila inaurata madagascariensis]|uniref:Scm-like with four MBT domains protein 2 n=1 Tax=Trichonephila inaurata madagascariensis TaxID=2747483 RepID=A0A8X7BUZ1_9ARAC|nr:scm-like with four MBT domains protein 2 [Trichonephila inaurata madagascariensis]